MPEVLNAEIMEFIDNGYSGTNFERPQVQKLIELVRANQIDCIIVKDFSRFGRNSIKTGYFIERVFPLFHTRFISISDDFLPESQRKSGAFFAILILILEEPFQVFKIDFSARKAKLYLAVVFRVSNFIKQTRPVEVVNRLDPRLQRRSSFNEIIDTAIV